MKLQSLVNSVCRIAAVVLSGAAVVSCADREFDYAGPVGPAEGADVGRAVIAIPDLSVPSVSTRVAVESDDNAPGGSVTLRWSDGDAFSLWAVGSEESCKNLKFAYHGDAKYSDNVYFVSYEVPKMAPGEYTYTAFYPYQSDESRIDREGNRLSYEIPVEQSGRYDGRCDIMSAVATRTNALVRNMFSNEWTGDEENEAQRMNLAFRHETHALKITVPEDKNLFGSDITRLRIEFPQPVAGELSFDTVTGEVDASGIATNYIDVKFDEPLRNGEPFWVFIAPATISGEVKFTAFGGENEKLQSDPSIAQTGAFGNLERAKITPVQLGIKEGFSVTWFEYEIVDWSRLGEEIKMLDITLPEGLRLADRSEDAATRTKKILPENDGKFKIAFRTEELLRLPSAVMMTAGLESEHAIVAPYASDNDKFTIAPDGYEPDGLNARKIEVVPYLFEEDFSSITNISNYDEYGSRTSSWPGNYSAVTLLDSGWTGARVGAQAGTAIRIACRRETSARYYARVDSAPMANLKEDASVKVKILFDYGADRYGGNLFTSGQTAGATIGQNVYLGYVTENTGYSSGDSTINQVSEFLIPSSELDGSYTNLPHKDASFEIEDCKSNFRITWRTYPEANAGVNNNTCWLYLDNIRVSIVNE